MIDFDRWFGKKRKPNKQSMPEPAPPEPEPNDYTKPEHFSFTAEDLMANPAEFNAAFDTAVAKGHSGEPYGVALYMALRDVSHNSQFLDDLVDELPNWAFAEYMPGAHMTHVLLNWARATEQSEKEQHACFRFWGVLCNWRPGDVNALWLDYRIGVTDIPPPSADPLGRNHLPEDLVIAPNEVKVYTVLSGKAEEIMRQGKTNGGS